MPTSTVYHEQSVIPFKRKWLIMVYNIDLKKLAPSNIDFKPIGIRWMPTENIPCKRNYFLIPTVVSRLIHSIWLSKNLQTRLIVWSFNNCSVISWRFLGKLTLLLFHLSRSQSKCKRRASRRAAISTMFQLYDMTRPGIDLPYPRWTLYHYTTDSVELNFLEESQSSRKHDNVKDLTPVQMSYCNA